MEPPTAGARGFQVMRSSTKNRILGSIPHLKMFYHSFSTAIVTNYTFCIYFIAILLLFYTYPSLSLKHVMYIM